MFHSTRIIYISSRFSRVSIYMWLSPTVRLSIGPTCGLGIRQSIEDSPIMGPRWAPGPEAAPGCRQEAAPFPVPQSPSTHVSPRHTSFAAAFAPAPPTRNHLEPEGSTFLPRLDVAARAALNARSAAGMEHNLMHGTAGGSPRCQGYVEYQTTSQQIYRPLNRPMNLVASLYPWQG